MSLFIEAYKTKTRKKPIKTKMISLSLLIFPVNIEQLRENQKSTSL